MQDRFDSYWDKVTNPDKPVHPRGSGKQTGANAARYTPPDKSQYESEASESENGPAPGAPRVSNPFNAIRKTR